MYNSTKKISKPLATQFLKLYIEDLKLVKVSFSDDPAFKDFTQTNPP